MGDREEEQTQIPQITQIQHRFTNAIIVAIATKDAQRICGNLCNLWNLCFPFCFPQALIYFSI
jgi:hypothetical protein